MIAFAIGGCIAVWTIISFFASFVSRVDGNTKLAWLWLASAFIGLFTVIAGMGMWW